MLVCDAMVSKGIACFQGYVHFTDILTRKLVGDVKLVGAAIACGGTPPGSGEAPSSPHFQSFAVATDAIGFRILQRNGSVFECDSNDQDVQSELRPSTAILGKGYNLDCLMVRCMHAHAARVSMTQGKLAFELCRVRKLQL